MSPRHDAPAVLRNFTGRLVRSRDFSISLILHLILIISFGSQFLYEAVKVPPEITTGEEGLYSRINTTPPTRPAELAPPQLPSIFSQTPNPPPVQTIISVNPRMSELPIPSVGPLPAGEPILTPEISRALTPAQSDKPSPAEIKSMREFREQGWVTKRGEGGHPAEYQFTAFIGQYGKGDWNSTILFADGRVESGSLPNLLYFMDAFSKNKVRTNWKNVKAIRLDSEELLASKPPFIFLTGTRDFELTPQEITNLRTYLMLGGAVWGDSSVPGKNSRFDIAFHREMKKVLGGADTAWEPLAPGHPIFTKGFFPEVRQAPPGVNSSRVPVEVLKFRGQVAVLYTANDYGNIWQIGLDKAGKIDLRRNEKGAFVATNEKIWNNRGTYLRNLSEDAVVESYKFGTNVVVHLLDRWEDLASGRDRL